MQLEQLIEWVLSSAPPVLMIGVYNHPEYQIYRQAYASAAAYLPNGAGLTVEGQAGVIRA